MFKGDLNELALFAGAGGGLLGSKLLGWRTVCYVERESYAIDVLKARIRDGMFDDAPIWDDVRTFDGRPWTGLVDVVSAGFPCQPWSNAGKQLGELDERNLWPDTIRIIREVRPEWVLLENVANLLIRLYVQQIFWDLAESGFNARWDCIPASAVGAPHLRDRVWIVAHICGQSGGLQLQQRESGLETVGRCETFFHPNGNQYEGNPSSIEWQTIEGLLYHPNEIGRSRDIGRWDDVLIEDRRWWSTEPALGRVANGVAHRVDRLAAIGAGQVPAVVRAAWYLLS